jgi:thioredoxin reductase (NADPH)
METAAVAIVGAGPMGIEVHWALRHSAKGSDSAEPVLHLDAGQVGSTMEWWAPGTRFFSSPERIAICGVPLVTLGQEKATREEYLAYLRAVVQQFALRIRTFERVVAVEPRGDGRGFLVRTRAQGAERLYGAERVVVAIGDMHRPRLLGVPGEDLPHVSHYFAEPHRYFGRRVLIVGGKNSAVEASIRCWRVGARVSLSYRRRELDPERVKYWLLPEIRGLIKEGHIGWWPQTAVKAITPKTVVLRDDGGGSEREVEADEVLLLTGYEMDGSLLEGAGVEMAGEQRAPKHNPRTMETSVPGLYVAGTAVAGTQVRFRHFIENCHAHAAKIAGHITGRAVELHEDERAEAALET